MSDILTLLADKARERVAAENARFPLDALKDRALAMRNPLGDFAFEKALKTPDVAFICECKKASPSKGVIAPEFPYLEIAKEYERAGADCVSVLTEPFYFLGADSYLEEIACEIRLPCLRKDFTVDERMIYEAKALGASAALLICSILDDVQLKGYIELCDELGLTALVETRDEDQVRRALSVGARVVGVNNRNLRDFSVDMSASLKLREIVGDKALFVAESGISCPEDVERLRKIGVDAVLVGETLMRAVDKRAALNELRGLPNGQD